MHQATGPQNNLICESHPLLDRASDSIHNEQFVTVGDSMSMVHASRGRLAPASPQLRSEVAIITELGRRLFGDDLGWREMGEDYSLIRKHIEHVVPGFDAYEERVSQPGGFMLPRPPRGSRTFETETGKAHFTVNAPTAVEVPDAHLLLQTARSHDQFNTTVYGLDNRYRGIKGGRHVIFVNGADLRDRGLHDGDMVDIVSVCRRRAARRGQPHPHVQVHHHPPQPAS